MPLTFQEDLPNPESLFSVWLKKYKNQIAGGLIGLLVLGGLILVVEGGRGEKGEIELVAGAETAPLRGPLIVDIQGAVANPGVYELTAGSRISDLLEMAGGFSGEADMDWVAKSLNLAAALSDEDKVYVPKEGDPSAGPSVGPNQRGKININTASLAELDSLPGIGPAYAGRIIDYRESQGEFKSVEDLLNVSGIGPKTLEKIRDKVTVR